MKNGFITKGGRRNRLPHHGSTLMQVGQAFSLPGLLMLLAGNIAFGQAPAGDAAKGKALFMKNGCYECHGTVGQGGTGPRIAPRTASLAYVRKPAGMPPYTAKVLPDADLNDILAYLMTIPAPPSAKSIAILNQ